jgi:hypothetical protein
MKFVKGPVRRAFLFAPGISTIAIAGRDNA